MDSGYSVTATPASGPSSSDDSKKGQDYWPLERCKKAYLDYLMNKNQEIEEQKEARRYYHGSHWTAKQIAALNRRKQPVVTFNRISRKIDGVVGLIERLRQDPKAYARTPEHDDGAELATAVLRYVLDEEEWKGKSPEVARKCAIDGFGGVELLIEDGDQGDKEVGFDVVEPDSFFYDPRSYQPDFTDARYKGIGKWMDQDAAIELMPGKREELEAVGNSSELSSNPDREKRWFTEVGSKRLVRLVEIWYRHNGGWCWAMFSGNSILMEGPSYFVDNKGKQTDKYVMFSCNVDQDGDRYGFVRNMKSAQDEYNHRRSKSLHILNSKRLIVTQGAVADIEKVRLEYARPDGVVVLPGVSNVNEGVKTEDQSMDFAGQLKLMENAISELENYGPNQALIGDQSNQSGRAIALLQQAGMAELGPYILGYRRWKLQLYRAIWNAVQRHWSAQRFIRVTDNPMAGGAATHIGINQTKDQNGQPIVDPQTGQPVVVNPIGSLDVDIIIDEGPDQINMQADSYDTLSLLASKGANIPPEVLIELSPLESSVKKKILGYFNKPDPMKQEAQQTALAGEAAKVDETKSKTMLNMAKAHAEGLPDQQAQGDGLSPDLKNAKLAAEVDSTQASAQHKRAQAAKTTVETFLAPHQAAHDAAMDRANLEQGARDKAEDRRLASSQTREPA